MSPWFTDRFSSHELHRHRLTKIVARTRTAFQNVVLADSASYGRCLIIDDEIQSAARDEFIYHESLVHPVMTLHPAPKDILVLGGGEGATLRELLRYPSVKRVTMVDIDQKVVDFCKTYLRSWHQGAFTHPKARVFIADARKYILETREQFDIIISDLPTPGCRSGRALDPGPLSRFYQKEFYRSLMSRLKRNGMFVTQAGSGGLTPYGIRRMVSQTLQSLFDVVRSYEAFVPSFGVPWAFVLATQGADPRSLSAARINQRIKGFAGQLRFYDGVTHEGLFRMPKYLRDFTR